MSDESDQAAKDKLEKAIKEYYSEVWALVVHKDSVELTAERQSVVSTLIPTGQAFHRTAGLLQLAAHSAVSY